MLTAAHVVGSLSAAHPLGQREVLLRTGIAATTSGDPAFVIPILNILDGLDIKLNGPDRPCTLS